MISAVTLAGWFVFGSVTLDCIFGVCGFRHTQALPIDAEFMRITSFLSVYHQPRWREATSDPLALNRRS